MTPRGAAMSGMILFILLLSAGSYLLDVPLSMVVIAAVFAIGVIVWIGTRAKPPAAR